MNWTTERNPLVETRMRKLVEQHREIQDHAIHLAVAYDPGRETGDLFLFELLGNFGNNEVSLEQELFEVTFESSRGFRMDEDQSLHLILTNPKELRTALDDHWKSAEEIRDAIKRGDFQVFYEDEVGREALSWFQ